MSETFGLEIYASNKLAYAGRAQKLIIPAVDGEQGFLAHHANVVAAIIPGEMRFEDADSNEYVFAVSSGFVEMINNRAKLFTSFCSFTFLWHYLFGHLCMELLH